jgi:diguanylate cyclase (GGDEF)-like protein/PAS domain S-box-containing protein
MPEMHPPGPCQGSLFPEITIQAGSTSEPEISILIIDDEARARQSLCDLISPLGHRTAQAASVADALACLQKETFTLALVDLKLPDGSGQEIMRYIQANSITTRLIVISGESTFDQATEALRNGACDFIRKPYMPATLLETVAREARKAITHTRYTRIQEELKGSEALHRFIVHNSPDMIYMLDDEGNFSFVNQRVRTLLGFDENNLIGKHYSEIVIPEDVEKAEYVFNERRTSDRASKGVELRLFNRHDKEVRFVEARAISVELTAMGVYSSGEEDQDAEFIGTYGVVRDITDRKRSEALMHYHEFHDQLTGLPNRTLFHDRLKMAMAQARRCKTMVGILFLDIDRFKIINDSLGHLAGDTILQKITQRLSINLREEDTLARVSGDEFLLLLPNIRKKEDAAHIAQKIIDGCKVPIHYQGQELLLTFSIGVVTYPENSLNHDNLIRNAYLAKCHVKQNGRNSYEFYQPRFKVMDVPILKMENALRQAIKYNELELYYQPQIDIIKQRVIGLEALLRWNHPHKGALSPGAFIPMAEQSNLICDLGQWVLERACQDARQLEERSFKGLKIAINTSMQHLECNCFKNQVLETTSRYNLHHNHLEIEITENSLMQDMQKTVNLLSELADNGIGIAVDDFGTGYSSLSYLQSLPVSTLKIDRSFVCDLSTNHSSPPIITAVITLAAALGINCIAEGVETNEQKTVLQLAGCRVIQGYYFCKPQSLSQITAYLRQARDGLLNHEDQLRLL